MRILLLSAYDAASHKRWRHTITTLDHEWTALTLPARNFPWRRRSSALTWALGHRAVLEAGYDAVLTTSTVDLATLRGLVPALAPIPTAVYFHENQLAYPMPTGKADANQVMLDLYTALCGDVVLFNSAYNRDSLLDGLAPWLRRMPDGVPPGVVDRLRARAQVLPVPLHDACFAPRQTPATGALQILWNHRWEYDKAPDRFFEALFQLDAAGMDFALHVVGQQFRQAPEIFTEAKARLAHRIRTWGHIDDAEDYRALLRRCDVVVSTALHEYQGLAMLEAVAAGCFPVAPDRLAYPEWFAAAHRYPSTPDDPEAEATALADHLAAIEVLALRHRRAPPVDGVRWRVLRPRYAAMLDHLRTQA